MSKASNLSGFVPSIGPTNNLNVGVITATSFLGNITGTAATFTTVSSGGTLTNEDVTNGDSIGIITARSDVSIADKIIHTGDTNTAIRFPAADTFTVETAGTERVRVLSNGHVVIGDTSDTGFFRASAADGAAADQYVGIFENLEATSGQSYGVNIRAGSNSTDHGFRVKNRANDTTQFIVRGDGNIGVGTASPTAKLDVGGTAIFKGGLAEKYNAVSGTLGSNTNNSLNDGNFIVFNGNESGNLTINFTNVHAALSTYEACSFTVIIAPNGSGVINTVQIDGQTPAGGLKWSGGSAPSAGSSGEDVYTFTIRKYGSAATSYTVYGAATNYA